MSFWQNLFGRKKRRRTSSRQIAPAPVAPVAVQPQAASQLDSKPPVSPEPPAEQRTSEWGDRDLASKRRQSNDSVVIYDGYGRQGTVSRSTWRREMLPGALKRNWDHPDDLAATISAAIAERCGPDALEAARHLLEIDPSRARAVRLLAEVRFTAGEIVEAQKLLETYIERHGEQAGVLAALGRIRHLRGHKEAGEKLLWRALELDANEALAVWAFSSLCKEQGGAAAELDALKRMAALPGSWRAQTALAWQALQDRKFETALEHYTEALTNAPKPAPEDLLFEIAAGLGSQGHLPEMVNLVAPLFDAKIHGLRVGAELLKAQLDLGQLDAACRILGRLRAQRKLAWEAAMNWWEMEIAKARREVADPIQITPDNLRFVSYDGPLWLDRASPAAELFPAKSTEGPRVAFVLWSAKLADVESTPERLRNLAALECRAGPLFLVEQIEFASAARARVVAPWVVDGGFPLPDLPYSDVRAAELGAGADLVVTGHAAIDGRKAVLTLRLLQVRDRKFLGTISTDLNLEVPHTALLKLARDLPALIHQHTGAVVLMPPGQYRPPGGDDLVGYLAVLDDLLYLRSRNSGPTSPDFRFGERAVLDRAIRLCLEFPRNVVVRILLAQTVLAMRQGSPEVVSEFTEKFSLLQREHGLSEPTHSVVQAILNGAPGLHPAK